MDNHMDELGISPFKLTVIFVGGPSLGWRWSVGCGDKFISSGSANSKLEARVDSLRALVILSDYWHRAAESELNNIRIINSIN